MSVLDAFFGRGGAFRGARCKTLLKLTIPRIKLLRNRREMHLKQMRRDIANLLASGQEATARIRVEHIIREENTMAAQEILELFCELIVVRLPIIELQRECPLDLKEAISSICFAAPRCADLVELQQAQMMFAAKYGRDFVYAATELLPDSGVNRQIIELLSVRAPPIEAKLKLLKEIAEEHGVDWEPLQSETEHEDLLNGPSLLVNSLVRSQEPSSLQESKSDSEGEVDFLDLPEVPNRAVPPPSPPKTMDQFLPFIVPPLDPVVPSLDPMVRPLAPVGPPLDPVVRPLAPVVPPLDPVVRPLAPVVPPLDPVVRSLDPVVPPPDPVVSPLDPLVPQVKSWQPAVEEPETLSSATISSRRSELDKDLQDAAAAANAAAETAERAAAAARLAARLAQVKMTQLVKTGMERDDDPRRDPFESFPTKEEDLSAVMMPEAEETRAALPDGRQTLRSTSLEDDPYFSYPNLFSRQNSSVIESPLVARSSGTDSSPR